ncbi:caspase family protein [Dactylosporangium sp. NPDC051541]|uniref:caspase family protein n=1 Tax=Dactylosporangium sp. NPDC051541 TaxID=3363977 RepID=UPI0037922B0C
MNDRTVAIQPVVNWPRTARPGQDYLVTVDVVLAEAAEWAYEREEFVVGCVLEGGARFAVEALGSTSVVLHRFGGTYGPVRFVVRAERDLAADGSGALRLTLVTEGGLPFSPIELPVLPAGTDTAAIDAAHARWTVAAPLRPRASRPTATQPAENAPAAGPTTRRTALLIGCQTGGLTGVENDVPAMAGMLERREFAVTRLEGTAATRTGILDAYEELIDRTEPGDVVVVYYAGHGGLARPPDGGTKPALQFIVPTDFAESTDNDFRGITFVELAVLVGRLTDITHNVTEIFDCSHAGHSSWTWDPMSYKAPGLTPVGGDSPAPIVAGLSKGRIGYDLVAHHVSVVMAGGFAAHLRGPIENPYAVRVVACAPEQSAYEYLNHAGVPVSVFTESLILASDEIGSIPIAWTTVLELVRRRVTTLVPGQWPDVEGPSRRLPFELQEVDAVSSLPVIDFGPGRAVLEGARLLGAQVGDEFTIMPGSVPAAGTSVLGTARVERIAALSAEAAVTLVHPMPTLPIGAVAVPEPGVGGLVGVRMPGDERWAALLTEAMAASPLVRPAGPEEETGLVVELDASGRSAIADRIGPLTALAPADEAEAGRTVENLERIARAAAVRWLEAPFDARLDGPIAVEWGLVAGGVRRPLPLSGGVLRVGERVYVSVRNDSDQKLYVSVIDVGVASSVSLLTANGQSGFPVEPGGEFLLGDRGPDGRLTGLLVGWPAGFPAQLARPRSFVVLVTLQPLAVGVLQQAGVRNSTGADGALRRPAIRPAASMRRRREGSVPPVPDPEPAATSSAGGLASARPAQMRYSVHTIDFVLQPPASPAR